MQLATPEAIVQIDDPADIAGAQVRTADGAVLGRVSAVHVSDGSDQPLFVQVPAGREDDAEYIVPVLDAQLTSDDLVLPYDSDTVRSGPTVDPGAVLSVAEVAWLIERYGAGTVDIGDEPITERVTGIGDVGAEDPEIRRLPPIVVVRPRFTEGGVPTIHFGRPRGEHR